MNMQMRSIEDLASFVRDLGSECTTLNIDQNYLVAGSKLGRIKLWEINTGQVKWSLDVDGPISDLEIDEAIYLTASAELHAINVESGGLEWSKNIEGPSDLIEIDEDIIFVTSSLYEIEIQDYTESTLFKFNKKGELLESIDFEEKAWFMKKNNDEIILGIGRPRCGFLGIDNENKILHNQTKGNSPVNMGIKTNTGFLLGHSDGTITEMNGKVCKYIQCGNDSITAMFSTNISWQVGNSNGSLFSSEGWRVELGGKISSIVETEDYIWVSTISGNTIIHLLDRKNGSIKYQFSHNNEIQLMKLSHYNLAISDEEGKIMFFDTRSLNKRIESKSDLDQNIDKRNLLKKRLRALRE